MKIAITGASGFIGDKLVPALARSGHHLNLIGRNASVLSEKYPEHSSFCHNELSKALAGCDVIIHLAARKNDQKGDLSLFMRDNVECLKTTLLEVEKSKIRHFVYFSNFLHPRKVAPTAYAQTKWEAERLLKQWEERQPDITVTILKIPAVYDERFKGKLSVINKAPPVIKPLFRDALFALRPTLHSRGIAEKIPEILYRRQSETLAISDKQENNIFYYSAKKVIDLSAGLGSFILLGWLMLIVAGFIRLESKGPAIFSQKRMGKNRQTFTCHKFRTMALGTAEVGTHEAPRAAITPLGAFLRRTKLDELPQAWNLLKGEMSLVGPRPCLPSQHQLIDERYRRGVFSVLPGITGLAQVQGVNMINPQKLAKLDANYIAQRSLPLDLKLIMQTATGHGRGDGFKDNEK